MYEPGMSKSEEHHAFEAWMEQIDRILWTTIGLGYMDLVDAPYRDLFHDGLSPLEMVSELADHDEIVAMALEEGALVIGSKEL